MEDLDIPEGAVDATRVLAWKCDCCDEVSVMTLLRLLPYDGSEPIQLSVMFRGDVAEQMAKDILADLKNPAPGYDAAITMPHLNE